MLTKDISDEHHYGVACECRPCRTYISHSWDKDKVHKGVNRQTDYTHYDAPICSVSYFIPKRERVIDAEEELTNENPWYDCRPLIITLRKDVTKKGHEEHYAGENEKAKINEPLKGRAINVSLLLVLVLLEEERLKRHSETLGEDAHQHANLVAGGIYAKRSQRVGTWVEMLDEDFLNVSISLAKKAHSHKWQAIYQSLAQKSPVRVPHDREYARQEPECAEKRTGEVGEHHVRDVVN